MEGYNLLEDIAKTLVILADVLFIIGCLAYIILG
jgi:hypothetical protein